MIIKCRKNSVHRMEIKINLGDIKADVWLIDFYLYNFFLYIYLSLVSKLSSSKFVIQRLTLIKFYLSKIKIAFLAWKT